MLKPDFSVLSPRTLEVFLIESNSIEGIHEEIDPGLITMVTTMLEAPTIDMHMLKAFVWSTAGAPLRSRGGMSVGVGHWKAPQGGEVIPKALQWLLDNQESVSPMLLHDAYLYLHPFMDGNGRSSRILWLHRMMKLNQGETVRKRSFLHEYYYQSLQSQKWKLQEFWDNNGWTLP